MKSQEQLRSEDYRPQTPEEYAAERRGAEHFILNLTGELTKEFLDKLRAASEANSVLAEISNTLDPEAVYAAIKGLGGVLAQRSGDTEARGAYSTVIDPEAHHERRRLQRAVERDPRTGLNNARMFDQARGAIEKGDSTRSFVNIDLNNLGAFNAYTKGGEDTGNMLIEATAIELVLYFGGEGTNIFRNGGDEFKILLEETADQATIITALMRNMGSYFDGDTRIALMKHYLECTDIKLVDLIDDEAELRILIKHLNRDLYDRMEALDRKITVQIEKGSQIERRYDDGLDIATLWVDGNVASLSAGVGKTFDIASEDLARTKKLIEQKYPTMKTLGKEGYESLLDARRNTI